MEFYKEILNQLGGQKFIAMTGAKHLNYSNEKQNLSFKIMRNAKKVTHVTITLNSMDLYDIDYIQCRNYENKIISQSKGIYDDMLRNDFEQNTGLYTILY